MQNISVYSKPKLLEALEALSEIGFEGRSLAYVATALFIRGLEKLDSRLDNENAGVVFAELLNRYENLPSSGVTEGWSLCVERSIYNRAILLCKECEETSIPLNDLVNICITSSLFELTSRA